MIYSLHNPVSQLSLSTEPPTPSHDSPRRALAPHTLFTVCVRMLSRAVLGNQHSSFQKVDFCAL